ncbi:MAG: O-acetylhomoserine aminocarboxypropyltransferase [Pseudomonadota bacterium]|nr:O-acetylhomoserine aminocarboxypropyltransferase [Pseudomonadota bacterium]
MVEASKLRTETLALHAGQTRDPRNGAQAVPIYQTNAYVYEDTEQAASLNNLEIWGYLYSRISNPTVAAAEERIAALEGGVGALGLSSGHAAVFLTIATLLSAGDHIVATKALYGGSINLMKLTLPRFGITTTFVDGSDIDAIRAAIQPNTRMIFGEVVGNPGLDVLDIAAVAGVAQDAGLPLVVDSTFTPPPLYRPFEDGANIVIHSATKWIGGHGIAMGGFIVDAGNFDWASSDKFPTLTEPYPGYPGMTYAEHFGPSAFIARARTEGLRDFGTVLSAQSAFYLIQGMETLSLRMERHIANARAVLDFLANHEAVAWVRHPDMPDHRDHEVAKRQLPEGATSMIVFGVKGGFEAGKALINSARLASHVSNVGDAKTLLVHPASTTHMQLGPEQRKLAGVPDDMIRLSVGIEHVDDIIDDLRASLRTSQRAVAGDAKG